MGVEPTYAAWEAAVLPMNYSREWTTRFIIAHLFRKCKAKNVVLLSFSPSGMKAVQRSYLSSNAHTRGITMKKLFALLGAVLLLGTSVQAVEVAAPSALLMEKETGTILYAKDEHARLEPASVTKIMTILLTMEAIESGQLSYDTLITASAHACSMGGSQIWLRENEQMSVEDMLKAVCVVSANDCAVALGEAISGSETAFVEKMNQRAAELGMKDTTFQNATGLPAQGHLTSAHDIALMSRELIRSHPDIRKYTTIWMDTLRGGASQLVNTNKLIRFYEGATGLKTGSTDSALYCLSGTAERDGMELIAVILKDATSAQRFEDAKTLLSHGFSTYALKTVTPETPLAPVPVELGTQATVQPVLGAGDALLVKKDQAAGLAQSVTLAESVPAPVAVGDQLGTLRVTSGDEVVAEIPLLAGERVDRITYGQMLLRLLRTAFLSD